MPRGRPPGHGTDGRYAAPLHRRVIEARAGEEQFGEDRLERLVKRKNVSVERLPHLILSQVLAFSRGQLRDDVALLALQLAGTASRPRRRRVLGQRPLRLV